MAVAGVKRKGTTEATSTESEPEPQHKKRTTASTTKTAKKADQPSSSPPPSPSLPITATTTSPDHMLQEEQQEMQLQLRRIAASNRTPFEKKVWSLLCQIPRGRVSTYGELAAHLGSSPRAVGNALRRNPFAPQVPCHRVVASGGGLGGFKGKWPRDGEGITLDEKRGLLRKEGVKLDAGGRVVLGTPFATFH